MYTGPEFNLQIRFAQLLSTVFVVLTFSSGMPILYAIGFGSVFMAYWIDKFLILRYYRSAAYYTKHLSKAVVSTLPWAVVLHMLFGLYMFSWPEGLSSELIKHWVGSNLTSYLSKERFAQLHMVIFMSSSALVLAIFLFRPQIKQLIQLYRGRLSMSQLLPNET